MRARYRRTDLERARHQMMSVLPTEFLGAYNSANNTKIFDRQCFDG